MTKRVVICGASSGIGKATALALSKSGCELVLAARRRPLLDELAALCEADGARALGVQCDVTQYRECEDLIKAAREMGSGVEPVLINSAGIAEFGDFATTPITSLDSQIRTNLLGPVYSCRAMIPWILEAGSGHIVNVLSIAARLVFPGAEAYAASKAGLLMFGRTLSASYRKRGLRVTSILPGATDTPLWDEGEGSPSRADMLSAAEVAESIRDLVMLPSSRTIDEITITPPKGVL